MLRSLGWQQCFSVQSARRLVRLRSSRKTHIFRDDVSILGRLKALYGHGATVSGNDVMMPPRFSNRIKADLRSDDKSVNKVRVY